MDREVTHIDPQAMEVLQSYNWPGNIRELQSVLKQALLHSSGDVILSSFLPKLETADVSPLTDDAMDSQLDFGKLISSLLQPDAANIYDIAHRHLDVLLLKKVLEFTAGNQHQAAKLLGISR